MSSTCENFNQLIPTLGVITHIIEETADTKTFHLTGLDGKNPFHHMPGQCAMLGIPGVGEAMFSISTAPTNTGYMAFSIKAVGKLTHHLHSLTVGSQVTIRGPYGTPFPVEDVLKAKDLLFIAGGIGLAPLRSVIHYVLDHREHYGAVDIVYGARSAADLVFKEEVATGSDSGFATHPNTRMYTTIDREEPGWTGHVGFVPSYLEEIGCAPHPNKVALICGPPIMIKYALEALLRLGFEKEQVYTTLEMRMKCGLGQCGRCNIGAKYICKDGPVFRCDQLDYLPEEY